MNNEIMMECDVDEATEIIDNSKKLKPKSHKHKKIRRLVDSGDLNKANIVRGKGCKRILVITSLITFSIALLMGHYYTQNYFNTKNLLNEFRKNYRNHYTEIVHGKSNYCDPKEFGTAALFKRIKQTEILHQEQTIHQIEFALQNESDFNAIALVGPVGVGKSLFMKAFHQNFPWQENVHTYAWNTYVNNEATKFRLIRAIIENLSECGRNLLVIENLHASDYDAVGIINKLFIKDNNERKKRVVLFYIFNLNTMLSSEEYERQKKLLQSLPNCTTINFKPFTQNELRDCIQREAAMENVSLTKENYDEIAEAIDPIKSGCKNVNAKVIIYATKR